MSKNLAYLKFTAHFNYSNKQLLINCVTLFTTGSVVQNRAYFGQGSESVLASHIDCSGNEETILQCPTRPTGTVSCYHYNAAGVECVGKYKSMMMSLYVTLNDIIMCSC